MTVGKVRSSIFTDIGNAIRAQAGTGALYKPEAMAAAVLALDGTKAGAAGTEAYKEPTEGVVSDKVFSGLAAAIRSQNGTDAKYTPAEMTPAILALTWDAGVKLRMLLTDDYAMEVSYLDSARSTRGANVVKSFLVDPTGYTGATLRPWDAAKAEVDTVYIDASVASAGVTSCAYWFHGFTSLRTVQGFEHLSGVADATQMFTSCGQLTTIYAASFDCASVKKSSSMFYGCTRLVGGTDSYVPASTATASVCKVGAGGVLTSPSADNRVWLCGEYFAGGDVVVSDSGSTQHGGTPLRFDSVCVSAQYKAVQCTPWADYAKEVKTVTFEDSCPLFVDSVNLCYWFYSCNALESVTGWQNLPKPKHLDHMLNGCTSLKALDLRGLSPANLASLTYTFSGCSSLAKIVVDAGWALPSGCTGAGTFYNCKALVGGAGTAYSSANIAAKFMRIDAAGAPGYLTAG